MIERRVVFSPEAAEDLLALYDWIAGMASPEIAMAYLQRLEAFCLRLNFGSERGQQRNDIRPGLRTVGFERRLTIAFSVSPADVTILRIFGRGRDWEAEL